MPQLFSQKESYNWYFGDSSGITFMPNGEEAKFLSGSKIEQMEGVATLSDRNGNLLFYSDGLAIWNKQHQYLPRGGGLKGHRSSSRSAIIIPKPGSNQYYYIFTITAFEHVFKDKNDGQYYDTNGLQYSMIDILADKGNGDIIDTMRNIKLLDNAVEKMITINHSNKTDVWLVVYNWKDNNFYTYLITKDGITEHKRTQRPSPKFDIPTPNAAGFNLEYDFQHNKLISCDADIYSFIIYDFNTATGTISTNNPITIPAYPSEIAGSDDTVKYVPYSAAISEDGTKLYGTCYGRTLVQWNLTAGNNNDIIQSRTIICDANTSNANNINFGAIRKGPDNKMYIARDSATWLAIINNPNLSADSCEFIANGIYLEGHKVRYGLPIMMNYNIPPCEFDGYAGGNRNVCYSSEVVLGGNYDTANFTFQWTPTTALDNPNILHPTCTTTQTIQYVLMIKDDILGCIDYDTIIVQVLGKPNIIQAEDVITCKNFSTAIGTDNNPKYVYRWTPTDYLENPNEKITLCTPDKDMIYILSILDTSTGCYNYDTVIVFVRNLDSFELLGAMYICDGKNTTISVKDDFVSYTWSTGESTKNITINEPGIYEVIVTDSNGCSGKRIFEISYFEADNFNIIAPNTICSGIETILKTNITFTKYYWSTGDTTPTTTIYSAGTYWVNVENENGCKATDTVVINETAIYYSFPNKIDFPVICNDSVKISNSFVNNGIEDIKISNIFLVSNVDFKINEVFAFPITISMDNQTIITIEFRKIETGNYRDTLIITLSSPCNAAIIVPVSAEVGGSKYTLSTIPIKTEPGNKITIPVSINADSISTSQFDFTLKCSYRRDMIQVHSVNIGTITDRTQNGLIETIQILSQYPSNTNKMELQLFANASLGRDTISNIIFFDLNSPFPCSNIDSTFTLFELIGCNLGERIFKFFNPTELLINTNNNNYDCKILSEEKGNFQISIYNIIGNIIKQKNWFKENNTFESKNIIIDNTDLVSGCYFIMLQSPNSSIKKQVLKIK
jgi:hypothetical protein